jgi:23S rRNA (guanosine2251-2'-O)-methyltransferase
MELICGIHPVLEAITAGTRSFERVLVAKGTHHRRVAEAIAYAYQKGIPLRFEARETLDRLAQGMNHQGLIAFVSAAPVWDLDAVLAGAHDPSLLMVLDGVEDPRNLGAILRNAEAAGADGVVITERHGAGLTAAVSRSSAGAIDHVRVARVGNLVQTLETLKARGIWVVGFDASGTERWDAVDYRRSIALVMGSEGRGIRRLVREHCDHLVSLPLFGHVTSLNVSVVSGVALYEVIRQRGSVPSQVRPIPPRHPAHERPGNGQAKPSTADDDSSSVEQEDISPDDARAALADLDMVEAVDECAWAPPQGVTYKHPQGERTRGARPHLRREAHIATHWSEGESLPKEGRTRDAAGEQAGQKRRGRRRFRKPGVGQNHDAGANPAVSEGQAAPPTKPEPNDRRGGFRRRRHRRRH